MGKYKIIDLFCGAGGLSLGFHLSKGFEIAGALDYWAPAIETFRYNHSDIPSNRIKCDDISKIFQTDFQEELINSFGYADVVVGGPPCQGMSLAGKRLNNDPRNQLFQSFVKAVEVLKPKIFVMENVPGLLSAEKGKIHKAILEAFTEIGYNHFFSHPPMILRAEDYGVPQIRRRLFYIGVRGDIKEQFTDWPPEPTHFENISTDQNLFSDFLVEKNPFITVADAISDLPQIKSGEGSDRMDYPDSKILTKYQSEMRDWEKSINKEIPRAIYNHEAPNHTQKIIDLIKQAAPGSSVDPKYTDSKKWKPTNLGYTVKALGAGGGSTNRRAFHYNQDTPRGSTIRENARIQSFPDWYVFKGSKTHQMTQVGNAVPPLLAKAIAEKIYNYLDGIGNGYD